MQLAVFENHAYKFQRNNLDMLFCGIKVTLHNNEISITGPQIYFERSRTSSDRSSSQSSVTCTCNQNFLCFLQVTSMRFE